ncbi:hypothetical protein [Nonomuraea bangladeshensis]|uniref:hypothetical protein n=1 Tax=Nonomuraea bangladeshensis TaxID=404385 RepID=UPI003C2F05C4
MTPYSPQDGQPYPPQQPGPALGGAYGQQYGPQQPAYGPSGYGPPPHAAPRRSQGLAITALCAGIVAVVLALTPLAGAGVVIGLIAAILAIIAMAARSQGGKKLAAGGLAAGLAAFPAAVLMYMWATDSAQSNLEQQQVMQKCMEEEPENIIECADLD